MTSTYPEPQEPSPFTTLPTISPSSWAHSASSKESLLASPTSLPTTSPLYYTTDSTGKTTTFGLIQPVTSFSTVTTVENGQTWYYPVPVTALPSSTSAPAGPNKTVTIVLSTVVTIVGLIAIAIVALLILRGRTRRGRERAAWRARYPSQWSWDAKYHDAEPDPTPLEPTTTAGPVQADIPADAMAEPSGSGYAFAPTYSPTHSRFPSSDLPRTAQPGQPGVPQPIHQRDGSL